MAGKKKFARFATQVWGLPSEGKTEEALAKTGVEARADFIQEIGLSTTFRELGINENVDWKEIADSCASMLGSYKKMTPEKMLTIFEECK